MDDPLQHVCEGEVRYVYVIWGRCPLRFLVV